MPHLMPNHTNFIILVTAVAGPWKLVLSCTRPRRVWGGHVGVVCLCRMILGDMSEVPSLQLR
ncbi:hypothetical protein M758_1G039300 [Ceratodon purpureus]|uniref:Uncharacterized protein n=1 Tax=Ceratodon purpureus TaxID=3225 RepID=A0A8T0J476_CERPU|nr:hypothetical protein KC19_1G041300 [Ceratodon purpureus]KAG0628611.1 hypothetical protein M758_1G039300 [Ceratodon purpureus]